MGTTEPEYLYLTTMGRRTGRPREIEIWFTHHAGRYYVLAEHGHAAQWVQNLRQDGRVQVRLAGTSFSARARVVGDAEVELAAAVRARSEAKYGWGDGLVIELAPLESPA